MRILSSGPAAISRPLPASVPAAMTLLPTVSSIPDTVIVFILTEPLPNQCLQSRQRVGPERGMSAPLDGEFKGTIESRNFIRAQALGLTLA